MAFNGEKKTVTDAHKGDSDKNPPDWKLLNPKAMTEQQALSGTDATEAAVVHGKCWYQIENDVTENQLGNYYLTVTKDEVHKIKKNLFHRVTGTTNDQRVGAHNQINIAQRTDEFMHTRTEIHHQPENRTQLTEDHDWMNKLIEWRKETFKLEGLKITTHWMPEIDLNPVFALEVKGITAALKYVAAETVRLDCEFKELAVATGLVKDEVKGLVLKVAGSHLKGIGANLNAGIAANGDSPMA